MIYNLSLRSRTICCSDKSTMYILAPLVLDYEFYCKKIDLHKKKSRADCPTKQFYQLGHGWYISVPLQLK